MSHEGQLDLFAPIMKAYSGGAALANVALYQRLADDESFAQCEFGRRVAIGRSGEMHSPAKRQVRWYQQTLRQLGLIEKVPGERGVWRATEKGRERLTPSAPKVVTLGFSTSLGLAIWGECGDVFSRIDEPIHLCLTSPPYPLAQPRAYGNPTQDQYVDFICHALEPIVKNLAPGGNVCLNISNDIFVPGSPARSLYRERLVIALHDRLGLSKMDEIVWENRSKAPGPIAWASKKRVQLSVAWEPVYWLTNDPERCISDNRRVLQPHSPRHQRLLERGGEQRTTSYGDGANRLKVGSFGGMTAGTIPKNVLQVGHRCRDQDKMRKRLVERGLPVHGASMPLKLASFLVEFLSREGDLVADLFGGWLTTAVAAQRARRRWIVTEKMREYLIGGSTRFEDEPGFSFVL